MLTKKKKDWDWLLQGQPQMSVRIILAPKASVTGPYLALPPWSNQAPGPDPTPDLSSPSSLPACPISLCEPRGEVVTVFTRSLMFSAGRNAQTPAAGSTMWTTTPGPPHGSAPQLSTCGTTSSGSPNATSSRAPCSTSAKGSSTRWDAGAGRRAEGEPPGAVKQAASHILLPPVRLSRENGG